MKKLLYSLIAGITLTVSLTGCGSDDITLGPDEADQWLHPYGATAADQSLQTSFYDETGIYLLFNDTLRKKQVATNPDGTPFYDIETVDLSYYMIGSSANLNEVFSYDYLTTDADKQAAVSFVQQQVLPHLSGDLLPFSILLVNSITMYSGSTPSYMTKSTPTAFSGYRCTALATSGIADMTDAQKLTARNNILQTIINGKLSSLPDDTFDAFYAPSGAYYSTYAMNAAAVAFFEVNPLPMNIGLLDTGGAYYRWTPTGSLIMYNIKAKNFDLEDYTTALFSYTEEEFTQKYGDYPIVMEKYHLLKQIYTDLGVVF